MDVEKYKNVCMEAFEAVKSRIVPNPNTRYQKGGSTGNLALNALKFAWEGENGLTFHMWIDEEVAPYMTYTNEPWISPKWKGKKNPNENWWNKACEFFMDFLTEKLQGELKND